jgi:Uma2 family endonuclease
MTEHLPLNTAQLPVKLRVGDYLVLDRSGAFADYAKTELIEGEILFMNAQHRPHALLKMKLYDHIRDALRGMRSELVPLVEASIALPPHDVPEPDIVLTSEPEGEGLIPLSSVALIVEVSDATLDLDLGRKAALYARHGIPEYWVADVNGRLVHQMWAPEGGTYTRQRETKLHEPIEAATVAGLIVDISAG